MVITDAVFNSSFYYIGAGLDAQPLWRFTHVCDTFLFTNLFLDKDFVRKWYESTIRHHHDAELVGVEEIPNLTANDYLPPATQRRQASLNLGFMTAAEQGDYAAAFNPALNEERWGLIFRIRRPSLNRVVTLYYLTAEGLATYLGLSDNGRLAPRVLCTIDTKVLEDPAGMMNRLFQEGARAPLLWVRGFEPAYHWVRQDNNVLSASGALPVTLITPNHRWRVGWSYRGQSSNIRHCRAFGTPETAADLATRPFRPELMRANHRLVRNRLDIDRLRGHPEELAVVPRRLRQAVPLPDGQVISWEDVGAATNWYGQPAQTAAVQVAALRDFLANRGPAAPAYLHLIPFCLEDEGDTYVRALAGLPCPSSTYLTEPADFLDLLAAPSECAMPAA